MTVEHDDGDGDALILRKAVREALLKFTEVTTEPDPAPWFQVDSTLVEMFSEGDEQGYIRRKKLERRTIHSLQIALLSGELIAQFSDGGETCDVPGWAWQGAEWHDNCWFDSRLPIDPFMPDAWYRWSGHDICVDRNALNGWLASADLCALVEPPILPAPHDESSRPQPITRRLPRSATFVTISEALSWIAFGISMDQGRLSLALEGMGTDQVKTQTAVIEAMVKLADLGTGGQVAMRGKYVAKYLTDDATIQTESIDPIRLADFAKFDCLHDALQFGTGLTWQNGETAFEQLFSGRDDSFRCVTVNRADLLKLFPDDNDSAGAYLVPLPAALHDIGPVMALHEALSWLAHGRPSHDIDVWQNGAGDLIFRDPSGAIIEPRADASPPPFMETYRQASRTIHAAFRDGSLPAYVAPASGTPLLVPRFYWNGANPESLHQVYRGMTPDDHGAGCPVLLSRLAFDKWRAEIAVSLTAEIDRAPSVKSGRPPSDDEILAKADEMKARGLDGRTIAKQMRIEPGFENVATTAVRDLIKGRWKPAGRPRKAA